MALRPVVGPGYRPKPSLVGPVTPEPRPTLAPPATPSKSIGVVREVGLPYVGPGPDDPNLFMELRDRVVSRLFAGGGAKQFVHTEVLGPPPGGGPSFAGLSYAQRQPADSSIGKLYTEERLRFMRDQLRKGRAASILSVSPGDPGQGFQLGRKSILGGGTEST